MSIQRYLITLVIAIITLSTFFAALHGYRASMAELDRVFDQELKSMANVIALAERYQQVINISAEPNLLYQVFINGNLTSRSESAPHTLLTQNLAGFDIAIFQGKRWRTFATTEHNKTTVVARPLEQRVGSAEAVLYKAIFPIVVTIPIIALVLFYIIRKSLRPLRNLSIHLQTKQINELTPIAVNSEFEELKPIETTLNQLFNRLKSAFEREKQLATNAAHELRTPISVLNINAHNLIKAQADNTLTPDQLIELQHNIERMAHVTEQIIALYRFSPEYFQENLVPTRIENILQQSIASVYKDITSAGQSISLEGRGFIMNGDAFSLTTLFENLLRNANKYSGQGAEIRVVLEKGEQENYVIVEDSGPGIPQEKCRHIFNRFYRANEQESRVKGSGLGLSIAKHIVDLHQGNITATQSVLGGLKLVITFPTIVEADNGQ